jgi:xylulose-5-phosphate/fructose-6-phosphate phosphoketolase
MDHSLDLTLPLSDMDAYWRASNYLSVGQMYLRANPLLRRPLRPEHVKPRVNGNWGPTPGQNFIYVHLNRIIRENDLNMVYIAGPGHGRLALVANAYLEGTYSELCPDITEDEEGLLRLFRQPSLPGGTHQGAEQERPLCRAYDVACGKADVVVACVVGDGDAESKPLSLTWEANEVVDPATDGAVLPILHLTGCAIGKSAILADDERETLRDFLRGNGYRSYFVEGNDPAEMHSLMAQTLNAIVIEVGHIQSAARLGSLHRPVAWPMLVVCTPNGWTALKTLCGQPVEETFRADGMPFSEAHSDPAQLATLEEWLRSYRPEELFDRNGRLHSELAYLAPKGGRRMGSNSHAVNGALLKGRR